MSDVVTTVANKLLLIYSMLDARIFDLSDSEMQSYAQV